MTYALTTFRRAVAGISWQAFLGESHCLDVPSSDLDKINDIKRKINDIKKKISTLANYDNEKAERKSIIKHKIYNIYAYVYCDINGNSLISRHINVNNSYDSNKFK